MLEGCAGRLQTVEPPTEAQLLTLFPHLGRKTNMEKTIGELYDCLGQIIEKHGRELAVHQLVELHRPDGSAERQIEQNWSDIAVVVPCKETGRSCIKLLPENFS
jgi:hypothetical protein